MDPSPVVQYSELARAAVTAMLDDDKHTAAYVVCGSGLETPPDPIEHARALALVSAKLTAELVRLLAASRGITYDEVWQVICNSAND